ncbi:hypothetical protein SG0102_28430 [Intestinibaculum porci]|jgi:iron-sulfur cluster repair protein YtfE (RIC family)|uniref:Iron-sulfur cluster repair di-iron protein, ric n=2 Tax=Intestinibaculum porci TaxID=2487118 RepID=A0A3G9JY37_9FIRM|nr:iron-sulfur cluster repair di-iron protein, ric [Intestinibaculum porci]BBH27909.1 hypothetical protein SG0102_28430 [Intestinibaculum porci]HIH34965.1 iron-sulfur cluster repair di-iron protein, ric [Methanosphaera sp.]
MTNTFYNTHNDILDLYTKAITKAHGKNHPEVFQVRAIYEKIQDKMTHLQFDLSNEFTQLRSITHNYAIPGDVCNTFKATYEMLEAFDHISNQ